ncbi:hypothetical protein [Tenacibaculum larymnensis]|uniref:Lipocalin-like domain-containing protein n=1 Tax=Tenacibaculum larymnensis TaxID=2878201 RepID=A0A9X4EVX2_9FLAO|nr:hypothetical protein [Tenacibaculum larymnensis]MDE1207682.1 hypothetical protein [Tenacibaculum larymnensis]
MKTYNSNLFLKHSKLLLGLVFILTLANCSKDDDNLHPEPEPTTKEKLTAGDGKWYLESSSDSPTNSCKKKSYHQFLADNTLIIKSYGPDYLGNCVPVKISSPYRVTNDTIVEIMDGIGVYRPFKILSLTNDVLVLQDEVFNTKTFDKTEG